MLKIFISLLIAASLLGPVSTQVAASYAESSVRVEVNTDGESSVVTANQVSSDQVSQIVNSDEVTELRQLRQEEFEQQQAESKLKVQEKATELNALREEKRAQLCATVQNRLQAHAERYQANGETYIFRIRHIEDVLEALIERFAASEIDVSALQAMLTKLSTDADSFNENIQAHIGSLQGVVYAACNGQDADYRQQMQVIRTEFEQIKSEGDAIKNYIENTIRPELEALKLQLTQNRPAGEM